MLTADFRTSRYLMKKVNLSTCSITFPSSRNPTGHLLSDFIELRRGTQHIIIPHSTRLLSCKTKERRHTALNLLWMTQIQNLDVNLLLIVENVKKILRFTFVSLTVSILLTMV